MPIRPCRRPRAPQSGPVGQVGRSETTIAFAGADRASTETAIAFACWNLYGVETVIAFAGAKWVFLVQFSGAEAMPVSRLPCRGASSGVVGFNVTMLSRLVHEKVRPVLPKHPKFGVFSR